MLNLKHLQRNKLILIGASTGGPRDIKLILKSLSKNFTATIIIAQHMGDEYIPSFISHLQSDTHLDVKIAHDNENLKEKMVYVTSNCSQIKEHNNELLFHVKPAKADSYNPSINELFTSCANFSQNINTLACILTGIGDDGANGMLELSKKNATCISANKESSTVYGMPLRAQEISSKVQSLSLDKIIDTINKFGVA